MLGNFQAQDGFEPAADEERARQIELADQRLCDMELILRHQDAIDSVKVRDAKLGGRAQPGAGPAPYIEQARGEMMPKYDR